MHKPHRSPEERLHAHLHTAEAISPHNEGIKPMGRKEHLWAWVIVASCLTASVVVAAIIVCLIT